MTSQRATERHPEPVVRMSVTTHLRRLQLSAARPKSPRLHPRIDWELWLIRLVHFVMAAVLLPVFLALVILCMPLFLLAALVQRLAPTSGSDDTS